MSVTTRCDASVAFLAHVDTDWAALIAHVSPCRRDPKAARKPDAALAAGYQPACHPSSNSSLR